MEVTQLSIIIYATCILLCNMYLQQIVSWAEYDA